MKRSERLMFLAGVLCAACAVTCGVVRTKEQKEKIKNSDAVILTIPADTVTALSWETGTENLSFHKEEMWTYDEDAAFPVDEEKIGELLEIFEPINKMLSPMLSYRPAPFFKIPSASALPAPFQAAPLSSLWTNREPPWTWNVNGIYRPI